MSESSERTYLAVPYREKDDAKALGARWDSAGKAWFVPAGVELEPFAAWMPAKGEVQIAVGADPRAEFAEALRECGLVVSGQPIMDGRLYRVPVQGDGRGDRSGAYVGHLDGKPAGFIENFRTGTRAPWKSASGIKLDAEDRARLAAEAAQKRHDRAIEREREYERVAGGAAAIWSAAAPVTTHPYLAAKGARSHGLRQAAPGQTITVEGREGEPRELNIGGRLLVPVADQAGKIASLQIIDGEGAKMFLPGGRVQGGHFVIGDLTQAGPILIAEGYATAATVHDLVGMPAVAAFHAANLLYVAEAYRAAYPDRAIYIAADNDLRREIEGKPNVGLEKAISAADAVRGAVLVPRFSPNEAGSDWNDLAALHGRKDARMQLLTSIAVAERDAMAAGFAAARQLGDDSRTPPFPPRADRTPEKEVQLER